MDDTKPTEPVRNPSINNLGGLLGSWSPLSDLQKNILSGHSAAAAKTLNDAVKATLAPTLTALAAMEHYRSLAPAGKSVERKQAGGYSPQMIDQSSPFKKYEVVVETLDKFQGYIGSLSANNRGLGVVWRGQRDASWGLHSSLYRKLLLQTKTPNPGSANAKKIVLPSEEDMVFAETKILETSHRDWRFEGVRPMELFARLQHLGAPTRFIDITRNPLVAIWFACQPSPQNQLETAGRIFALATNPLTANGPGNPEDSRISLNDPWNDPLPYWHYFQNQKKRQELDWGTGSLRRVWFPPSYLERIAAQDGGFLVDGVPIWRQETASYFKVSSNPQVYWSKTDIVMSSSIYARFSKPSEKPKVNKRNFAPTYTFVIPPAAKASFLEALECQYGINRSSLFPDHQALADHLAKRVDFISSSFGKSP